jgi:Na+-driven multidrug efflux pump
MLSKPRKDFTDGPIFFRMIAFAIPVMLTGVLQILYSMADNMVVGKFSNDIYALGAVGSTTQAS